MLVIVTDHQLLSPQTICQTCLLADGKGQPRWHQGKLGCGHLVRPPADCQHRPVEYECCMGFRVAQID